MAVFQDPILVTVGAQPQNTTWRVGETEKGAHVTGFPLQFSIPIGDGLNPK
jgi:hypothetical protein